jgi:hypothetical protein
MAKRGFRHRALRVMAAFAMGGSVFQLSTCDPAVRDTILSGLQVTTESLTDTLISAFFTSLQNEDGGGGSGLTTAP